MKRLEWEDRFFLLGKAVRLNDLLSYETTVAGFENESKSVTLHHANSQTMDRLLANYEIFYDGEWRKIGLSLFRITFRHIMQEDYFRPLYDISNQYTNIYGIDKADATKRFFEQHKELKGELDIKAVELVESQ